MVTIIAGSRSITDYDRVCAAISNSGIEVTEVVSGHAGMKIELYKDGIYTRRRFHPSVDQLGERWSREVLKKPPTLFPADWTGLGKSAGFMRNELMARYAAQFEGALIAVWDGVSKGTLDMIKRAKFYGLRVYVDATSIDGERPTESV